jgi:glyoxylase-like metal-dependent hydrolase (beta-lactamase superfamily II)
MSVASITFGAFTLTPILDGYFRLDGGAMFGVVPRPLWEKVAPPDDRNRIRLAMRAWLVRGLGHTVLIDAGAGSKLGARAADIYGFEGVPSLVASLAAAGVTPTEVDTVIASHLHFDHAGGFTVNDGAGRPRPQFPEARHVIARGEWDDARAPHERSRASYFDENYVPLAEAGLVDFVERDGEVRPGIRMRRTVADLLPTAAHLPLPYIMGYDLYPMETLEFKRGFLSEAVAREYLILFEHDPVIAAGIIARQDGKAAVTRVL